MRWCSASQWIISVSRSVSSSSFFVVGVVVGISGFAATPVDKGKAKGRQRDTRHTKRMPVSKVLHHYSEAMRAWCYVHSDMCTGVSASSAGGEALYFHLHEYPRIYPRITPNQLPLTRSPGSVRVVRQSFIGYPCVQPHVQWRRLGDHTRGTPPVRSVRDIAYNCDFSATKPGSDSGRGARDQLLLLRIVSPPSPLPCPPSRSYIHQADA